MDGIYYKEWSAVLDRAMEFKRYGHSGVPVLALPARGGRFYDWENNGMPEAVASLLHAGKVQLFCADSIDGESLLAGNSAPRRRAEMQEKYFPLPDHRAGSPCPGPDRRRTQGRSGRESG